jgi:hypothetical protein
MDLYNSSPAACAVWASADAHLLIIFANGFSIVEIVRKNPKMKIISAKRENANAIGLNLAHRWHRTCLGISSTDNQLAA